MRFVKIKLEHITSDVAKDRYGEGAMPSHYCMAGEAEDAYNF